MCTQGQSENAGKPHSLDQISDERLKWWREGQLKYILRKEKIRNPRFALEVGVGEGHWAVSLFSLFRERPVEIFGIDEELHWVERSRQYLSKKLPNHIYASLLGSAYDLKFESEKFDLVTCQTLLMHLEHPDQALSEMCRVLRPNGVLLISEPLNQLNMSLASSLMAIDNPNLGRSIWGFWLEYHSALKKIGYGDHNIAAYLSGFINDTGQIETVSAYHSDLVSIQSSCSLDTEKLLKYLHNDPKSRMAIREMGEKAFVQFDKDLTALKRKLESCDLTISWPQQNILFVCKKKTA